MAKRLPMLTRIHRARSGLLVYAAEMVGSIPSHTVRLALYRRLFSMRIGDRTTIYRRPEIRSGDKIEIGSHCSIGKNAILDGRNGIRIGHNVNFSSEVAVWTNQHDPQSGTFEAVGGPVVIEDYAWLSFRTTILPGVRIGRGAVVAAGALVTKDVPEFAIMAGVPAKQIGTRNTSLHYQLDWRVPFL